MTKLKKNIKEKLTDKKTLIKKIRIIKDTFE